MKTPARPTSAPAAPAAWTPRTSGGDPGPAGGPARPLALVLGSDADGNALVAQWLAADGFDVRPAPAPGRRPALVVADLPRVDRPALAALRAMLAPHGDVPLLVLSPRVFASVDCFGPTAQALGADGLLPKPTGAVALRRAVRRLAGR